MAEATSAGLFDVDKTNIIIPITTPIIPGLITNFLGVIYFLSPLY